MLLVVGNCRPHLATQSLNGECPAKSAMIHPFKHWRASDRRVVMKNWQYSGLKSDRLWSAAVKKWHVDYSMIRRLNPYWRDLSNRHDVTIDNQPKSILTISIWGRHLFSLRSTSITTASLHCIVFDGTLNVLSDRRSITHHHTLLVGTLSCQTSSRRYQRILGYYWLLRSGRPSDHQHHRWQLLE